jgi:hypothetical protein
LVLVWRGERERRGGAEGRAGCPDPRCWFGPIAAARLGYWRHAPVLATNARAPNHCQREEDDERQPCEEDEDVLELLNRHWAAQ